MCGDLDEEDAAEQQLYAAFLIRAHSVIHDLVDHKGGARSRLDGTPGPIADRTLHGYMDGLFADVMQACVTDGRRVDESERYRLLSSQAIVLARLAGFFAGQLDVAQDPLRNSVEALMAGYASASVAHDAHSHDHSHG